jgi:hypothetical protein
MGPALRAAWITIALQEVFSGAQNFMTQPLLGQATIESSNWGKGHWQSLENRGEFSLTTDSMEGQCQYTSRRCDSATT